MSSKNKFYLGGAFEGLSTQLTNLPLWDMVFGTFRNPATWDKEAGFYKGASSRIWDMLIGRDVSEPPTAEKTNWVSDADRRAA
jgi:sterol desaturase/sphingolipid hydroxylase (fatty acid hydroxylase superfamily)